MKITLDQLSSLNKKELDQHKRSFNYTAELLTSQGIDVEHLLKKVKGFDVATPSWALATGGTRFGRFPGKGEPVTLENKIDDVGLLKALSAQTGQISLHIPWDIPKDYLALKEKAMGAGLSFASVNSNTFQDQPNFENANKKLSYKFGSLGHSQEAVRDQAIAHNLECIEVLKKIGAPSLTIWLADGSNFPGQANFRHQFKWLQGSLQKIYMALPQEAFMYIEHKAFEPNFYSSINADWGSSLLLAKGTGDRCLSLVDLGHHLPNANIEQVVSRLLMEGRLAGFHFNDSKYSDDDLTTGCLRPYQLFLIFVELRDAFEEPEIKNPAPAWMIDASHNTKDPLEDLLQSLEAIHLAHLQSLLISRPKLAEAQVTNDPVIAQEILQHAFRTDIRPILAEARLRAGAAISPIKAYRELKVREQLAKERS